MKTLYTLLFVCTLSLSATAQSDSLDAKIGELLSLSGAEQQFMSALNNMIQMQRGQADYAEIEGDWWDEFSRDARQTGWEEILPELVKIYAEMYTEEEIDHQIAYLQDPITQQIVGKQSAIMQRTMAVGGEWGQSMAEQINRRLQKKVGEKK